MSARSESGMNIFEMIWFILFVIAVFFGGAFGYAQFRMYGAVLGALIGGGLGLVAAASVTFLLAVVFRTLFCGTLLRPRKPTTDDSNEGV